MGVEEFKEETYLTLSKFEEKSVSRKSEVFSKPRETYAFEQIKEHTCKLNQLISPNCQNKLDILVGRISIGKKVKKKQWNKLLLDVSLQVLL